MANATLRCQTLNPNHHRYIGSHQLDTLFGSALVICHAHAWLCPFAPAGRKLSQVLGSGVTVLPHPNPRDHTAAPTMAPGSVPAAVACAAPFDTLDTLSSCLQFMLPFIVICHHACMDFVVMHSSNSSSIVHAAASCLQPLLQHCVSELTCLKVYIS